MTTPTPFPIRKSNSVRDGRPPGLSGCVLGSPAGFAHFDDRTLLPELSARAPTLDSAWIRRL